MSTPRASRPAADRRTLIADTAIDLVATSGLRGLTHRAVDGSAGLPAGSTSYYFRTRTALIGACYARLAELDLGDVGDFGDSGSVGSVGSVGDIGDIGGVHGSAATDRETAAAALAALLHRWLTVGRARQLARFELSLEAARNPELEADFHRAGQGARARASGILAALGAPRPEEAGELLVAWTDGLLYDRLAGALARSRPAPDLTELTAVTRRMLDAVLAGS